VAYNPLDCSTAAAMEIPPTAHLPPPAKIRWVGSTPKNFRWNSGPRSGRAPNFYSKVQHGDFFGVVRFWRSLVSFAASAMCWMGRLSLR
jgi:hypothetical protein